MRPIVAVLAILTAVPAVAQLEENVTVERILVDVRVFIDGLLSRDLEPEDFEVTVGRKQAQVESVTFVNDLPGRKSLSKRPVQPVPKGFVFPEGRLLIVFIQTDFARHPSRLEGQMKFLQYGGDLLDGLQPEDRVAVFSFDSHLKFRLDFTNDREAIVKAMFDSLRIDLPAPPPAVPEPSLASRLDRRQLKASVSSEAALRILADAVRDIPGQKTLLLLGWGLGLRKSGQGGVGMRHEWPQTRKALDAARIVIHALDTTYADSHDLEVGLKRAAAETGGIYSKTHVFPEISIAQVRGMIAGHYELELRRPARLREGAHDLRVRVKRDGATVYAPSVIHVGAP